MRNYKRKTERGKTSEQLLRRGADAVIKDGRKIKTVAQELEICLMTLFRFVKKLKAGVTPTVGYYSRQVFNPDYEKILAEYLLICSSIYFGLLPEEVRKLAEEKAIRVKGKSLANGKGIRKGKAPGKGKSHKSSDGTELVKRRVLQDDDPSSDDKNDGLEWFCIICCDSYSNSLPREQWIECVLCKNWAHLKCLDSDEVHSYVCPNCKSDDEASE